MYTTGMRYSVNDTDFPFSIFNTDFEGFSSGLGAGVEGMGGNRTLNKQPAAVLLPSTDGEVRVRNIFSLCSTVQMIVAVRISYNL
jgi:hypothetical protein